MTALLLVCALVVLVSFAKSAAKDKNSVLKPKAPAPKARGARAKAAQPRWPVPDYGAKSTGRALKVHELHDLWRHERNVHVYIAARRNGTRGELHRPRFAEMNLSVTGNHDVSRSGKSISPGGVIGVFADDAPGNPVGYQIPDYRQTRQTLGQVITDWSAYGVDVMVATSQTAMLQSASGFNPAAAVIGNYQSTSPAGGTVGAGGMVGVIILIQ
jgi:hypothetical protein